MPASSLEGGCWPEEGGPAAFGWLMAALDLRRAKIAAAEEERPAATPTLRLRPRARLDLTVDPSWSKP